MIYERIKILCEQNKISIYRVEKDLGFSASSIVKWKTAVPAADKLKAVADYFHLPMEYFLSDQKDASYKIKSRSPFFYTQVCQYPVTIE